MPPIPAAEDTPARAVKYAFPGERGIIGQALTMEVLRSWLAKNRETPGAVLLKQPIRFVLEGHERDRPTPIPMEELLVAELDVDGRHYVLSDGEVLRVDSTFLQDLNARLEAAVPWSDFPFPTFEGGTEPDYLQHAGERSHGRLLLLDEDPVRLPGETPFEVCDLLSDDRRLIFAKLKGRSSLFSHLAVQVETAAELLLRSEEARKALTRAARRRTKDAALLAAADAVAGALREHRPDDVTITLLLLGSWRQRSLTALPLVSRLRLRRTAQRIAALGYRLEIAAPEFHRGHLPARPRIRT